jgi:WD40 repeat protein
VGEFSPDGTQLATTFADRTARLWDVATGRARAILTGHTGHTGPLWWGAFSSDGTVLATTSADQSVRLWAII